MTVRRRRSLIAAVTAAIIVLGAAGGFAQRIWFGGYGYTPPRFPTKHSFQGSFNFCRAMFQSSRREKRGWSTDYPGADLNFSTRLAELTKAPVTMRPARSSYGSPTTRSSSARTSSWKTRVPLTSAPRKPGACANTF
jgi:hypothetical protein